MRTNDLIIISDNYFVISGLHNENTTELLPI